MFKTFDDCLDALLSDQLLHSAKGGSITKHDDEFQYRLYGSPEAVGGTMFFDLPPSAEEGIDWVAWPVTDEARAAYEAFKNDNKHGKIVRRLKLKP
jgi:hypothetical protein